MEEEYSPHPLSPPPMPTSQTGDGQPNPLMQERVQLGAELTLPPSNHQYANIADSQTGVMAQEKGMGAEFPTTPPLCYLRGACYKNS